MSKSINVPFVIVDKEAKFCDEYIIDWNASRAARAAGYTGRQAEGVLKKAGVKAYIEQAQLNLQKAAGISALRNVLELKKIAYTNVTDFKKDWFTLKDFNDLDDDTKAAISEMTQTEIEFGDDGTKKTIKFKLHDKIKAIETLNKMLGFNATEKKELTINDERKSINDLFPPTNEIIDDIEEINFEIMKD